MPPAAPMNMPGKTGPPRKLLSETAVGEALADDEQQQRTDGPAGGALDQGRERVLTREEHLGGALAGRSLANAIASPPTARPAIGVSSTMRRSTIGLEQQARAVWMPLPSTAAASADRDRPEELGARSGLRERRDVRDRRARRCRTRSSCRDRRRSASRSRRRAARARARPRAWRRRARRPPSAGTRPAIGEPSRVLIAAKLPAAPITTLAMRRRVPLDQVHGEHAQAAADRDQRRLGPEHDARGPASRTPR